MTTHESQTTASELEQLQQEIFDRVARYYQLAHAQRPFVPGETRVGYAGRVWDEHEMINMVDAILEFWLTAGRYAQEFESKLGSFLGVREVIPVNSGSSANLVAITALTSRRLERPLQPGDEVITPAVTFPTTLAPIIQNNLVPVFIDCELGNYNIKLDQLEPALSSRTRALFFPHTLGNPVDMERVMAFAREHDLYVVEDTCDALGSRFDGQMCGTFGQFGTLSCYPAHHITTGEGGAVFTQSPKLAKIARSVRDWGRDCWCHYDNPPNGMCGKRFQWQIPGVPGGYDHRYYFTEIGYNLKLTDVQAAMGVAQMEKLPDFIAIRKRNFGWFYEGLQPYQEFLILPTWHPKADVSWFVFPITVRPDAPFTRRDLTGWLESHKIETRLLFAGDIRQQPAYRDISHRTIGALPNSEQVLRGSFFVGVYPGLDRARIDYILETFASFFSNL
jgi:CDP-6-deoxy-D-xylo-4-hexulose-3-dehydrase